MNYFPENINAETNRPKSKIQKIPKTQKLWFLQIWFRDTIWKMNYFLENINAETNRA